MGHTRYPVLALMESANSLLFVGVLYLAFMVLNALLQVPAFPMFTELFGGSTRYTGVSLGFNLGTILAGGSAPSGDPPTRSSRAVTRRAAEGRRPPRRVPPATARPA
ncbi:hypothetical protein FHS23_001169 [Prauserella isguenensis]|uniref:Major facilitator superfamily (MFS) profile domain-containing protein n=1 Tax=Prauserella isguenensis TaxID=1470180 RepID=A0A839RYP7_9PSEU|nr:hypothetical protein [Prauserella isguenensis]MBB3050174.1 hypothetical protein [Prauserella isguenensis]